MYVRCLLVLGALTPFLWAQAETPPRAGKVQTLPSSELKRGMKATAWTVFEGSQPEAVPIEIIGVWQNAWGPKQDIILGKMGGRAQRTNVAGGMSGSPVYIDGKLIGAVSLRLSVLSPDAICGITPIDLMLEINDFDQSKPATSVAKGLPLPMDLAPKNVGAAPLMVPIGAPLTLSGFSPETLRAFSGQFEQMGVNAVLGGGGGTRYDTKPAADWKGSLQPGQAVSGVLVSGDLSVTGLGTVTYNDGHRVLAFGHPFFNLGPVNMPMSRAEILMVLASQLQPNKFGNATEIVGALKQDRHSGIMGILGEEAPSIPVTVRVKSQQARGPGAAAKDFRFNVFVQQRWTPFLMMLTLFNSIQGLNEFADESTYRLSGSIELDGNRKLNLGTMAAPTDVPIPAPMMLAGWWGDKFTRLYGNSIAIPKLKTVNVEVELLPERRVATVENVWLSKAEVQPGEEVSVRAYLRPYRGERVERTMTVKIPAGIGKGDHRIMVSDADTLNRMQSTAAQMNRFLDVSQTLSLIEQERSNSKLYVSLVQSHPTVYYEDKAMPNLPASVMNVMQAARSASRPMISARDSASEQAAVEFGQVVTGSASARFHVK